MRNDWYYNNPYMYLIVKDKQLPIFINEGHSCIPIFAEYEYADNFRGKYLLNKSAEILSVSMLNGIRFLENLLELNHYILQIIIYAEDSQIISSKEFIKNFYEYKKEYGYILNDILKNKNIKKDTLIMLLANAPIHILIDSQAYQEGTFVITQDINSGFAEMTYINNEDSLSIHQDKSQIIIFTNKDEFEKYKLGNNSELNIKKYSYIEDLLDYLNYKKIDIDSVRVNPCGINCSISIEEIEHCLSSLNDWIN